MTEARCQLLVIGRSYQNTAIIPGQINKRSCSQRCLASRGVLSDREDALPGVHPDLGAVFHSPQPIAHRPHQSDDGSDAQAEPERTAGRETDLR